MPLVATNDGTHHSLVARTGMCGWAITDRGLQFNERGEPTVEIQHLRETSDPFRCIYGTSLE